MTLFWRVDLAQVNNLLKIFVEHAAKDEMSSKEIKCKGNNLDDFFISAAEAEIRATVGTSNEIE